MKRCLVITIIACLLLTFYGCKSESSTETTAYTATESLQETTDVTPQVTVKQQPMSAVSLPVVTESEIASDGTVIFTNTYQDIALTVPDPDVAEKVIVDFLNRVEKNSDAKSVRDSAVRAYQDSPSSWSAFASKVIYKPMRIDLGILSLSGEALTYQGGAHAQYVTKTVTYDLLTGNVLKSSDIFTQSASSDSLTSLVLEALAEQKSSLFEDYEATVTEKFGASAEQNADWYFSCTGLCYFFSPYEIGPFASGTVVAEIPYSKLTGILKDEYFPSEKESINGKISVQAFGTADLNKYTQTAEVILNESAEKILIYTDTKVDDIRIDQMVPFYANPSYNEPCTIFATGALTPGDAILVHASKDTVLSISYTAAGKQVTETISFD